MRSSCIRSLVPRLLPLRAPTDKKFLHRAQRGEPGNEASHHVLLAGAIVQVVAKSWVLLSVPATYRRSSPADKILWVCMGEVLIAPALIHFSITRSLA